MAFRFYNGEANNKATKAFLGEDSGIRDYDDIRYDSALEMNKGMFGEYWIEDEIKLQKDIEEFKQELNNKEQFAFAMSTAGLNWLDSLATDFNYLLGLVLTDSAWRSVIALINSFEVLHNRSYQYLTSSVLTDQAKRDAFDKIRKVPEMVKRNNHIIEPLNEMCEVLKRYIANDYVKDEFKVSDEELLQAIFKGLVNYMTLEGLYFSGGFVYFHSLARTNRMIGSNSLISMIKEDENRHTVAFGALLQILVTEHPHLNTDDNMKYMQDVFKKALELEKDWSRFIYDGIDTLSLKEYDDYMEYLTNLIMRNSGLNDLFPNNSELKSKWINTYGSKHRPKSDGIATREDFLQTSSITYQHDADDGFDL